MFHNGPRAQLSTLHINTLRNAFAASQTLIKCSFHRWCFIGKENISHMIQHSRLAMETIEEANNSKTVTCERTRRIRTRETNVADGREMWRSRKKIIVSSESEIEFERERKYEINEVSRRRPPSALLNSNPVKNMYNFHWKISFNFFPFPFFLVQQNFCVFSKNLEEKLSTTHYNLYRQSLPTLLTVSPCNIHIN